MAKASRWEPSGEASFGLVSMQERVRLVHGELAVKSKPGEGTRVKSACGCRKDKTMNPRPRILLADDHTMLLAAFQQLLAPACDVVGAVSDGRMLLAAAPRLKPDVIVLDISMPLLNGIDACRQLQPRLPDTRWIFLTVNEDPDLAAEAFGLGASGFPREKLGGLGAVYRHSDGDGRPAVPYPVVDQGGAFGCVPQPCPEPTW